MEIKNRQNLALKLLRSYLAVTMIVHGTARVFFGGVSPFGEFLSAQGFPLGYYLALSITIFEIVGGIILISGYFAMVLSLLFVVELIAGIVLVHASEGWFVVGLGRNGMEYSVLLIVSFIAVGYSSVGKGTAPE